LRITLYLKIDFHIFFYYFLIHIYRGYYFLEPEVYSIKIMDLIIMVLCLGWMAGYLLDFAGAL
jgi:hypothetical protein